MKLATATNCNRAAGFTLVEVLAALLFMAIVVPVAIEALHMATKAGEIAVRKNEAARVADTILNKSIVMTNWNSGTQSGTVSEGAEDFRWTLTSQTWPQDSAMQLVAAEVTYSAQAKDYSVTLSTLASPQTFNGTTKSQ
ncbi:MAG TPA: hypothetical protein VMV89_06850 [Candidatus Paceibacterota bacterium]|nr:hypothetical protein [Candidatus Paceibacterota bacterium]